MVNGLKQKMNILRYPRLDTVLMVEETIQKLDYYPTKMELWKALPKKMMYPTFSLALDYLLVSGKISVDSEGKIGWIFYPKESNERLKKAHLIWNSKK